MKIFFISLLISLFLLTSLYGFLSFEGLHSDTIPTSNKDVYGIIYGNKVELDGEPSERLLVRLDAGYELYENDSIQKLIMSGGVGIEGFDEAVVMKEYLLEKGIEENDIIVDSYGYTTSKTSKNALEVLGEDIRVVGISQWYHIARVKLSLKQAGFETVHGYSPRYFELRDMYSIMREGPAYIKYLF